MRRLRNRRTPCCLVTESSANVLAHAHVAVERTAHIRVDRIVFEYTGNDALMGTIVICAAVVTATVSTTARRCQLTACKSSPTTTLRRQLTFAMAIRSIGQDSADNMGVTSWWPGRRSTTWCAATRCRRPIAAKLVPLRRQCSASATVARRHQLAVCRHAPQPRQQLSPLRRGGMHRCLGPQDRNRTHLGAPSPTAARSRRAVDLHTNHTKNVAMNSRSSRARPCTSRQLEPRALRHIRFECDSRRRGRGAK